MTDYFTQLSFNVPLETDAEKEWFLRADKEISDDLLQSGGGFEEERQRYADFLNECSENDWEFFDVHFRIMHSKSDDESKRMAHGYVWFVDEEAANVDQIAAFLQMFLKQCRPNGAIAFTWANTCSKMRTDAWDGGGYFITADKREYTNTTSWCEDKFEEWERQKGGTKDEGTKG